MKKLLSIALAVLMLLPIIAGCTPTPAPETNAPETDAPETDAPETDAPETDVPETDAPETDAPETDAPAVEQLALAADSPIKDYDIAEFVPEDKKDPACSTGFVMQARKFKYRNDDLIIVHLTNATDTAYTVRLTIKYLDEDGKSITGARETIPDVGAGWDNYYIYNPDFHFESFTCSLSISSPCADSVTGSIRSNAPITYFTASSGLNWTDPTSLRSEYLNKEYAAVYAKIPYENTAAEPLHIVADYVFFDENGNIFHYDATHIPTVAATGNNEAVIPLKFTSTPWNGGSDASLPEAYQGEAVGIVAYRSILNDAAAEADRVKATTADFGEYTFQAQNGVILPYRLYLPSDYDKNKEYPVLLILHANGSQGKDNQKQMGDVEKFFGDENSPVYDCIVFAPQCPPDGWWLSDNIDAVAELLDFVNAYYSTDKSRQYVTGFSMGGCGTWNLLTRYPEKVSAAVPCAYAGGLADFYEVDDPVYSSISIIHEDGNEVPLVFPKETLNIPIHYIFSTDDETISAAQCRYLVEAFESVDAKNFTYTEDTGLDHGTMGASYISKYNNYELLYWLLEQRRETK